MTPQERAQALASIIGISTSEWKGNCMSIATKAVESGFVEGFPRYGMYFGEVSPDSYFASRNTLGCCRHGWVALKGGGVFDPTRWVFEAVEPYIYEGPAGMDYDYGMARFRMMFRPHGNRRCPRFVEGANCHRLPDDPLLAMFIRAVCDLEDGVDSLTVEQVFWLANRIPAELGSNTLQVFSWIESIGHRAFIPIDFQPDKMLAAGIC